MGSMLNSNKRIYTFEQYPMIKQENFIPVKQIQQLSTVMNGKILIPTSKIKDRRNFIWKHHHQVILLNDQLQSDQMINYFFKGIPLINEYSLSKDPTICFKCTFNSKLCPIPLILERFHQSYLNNYLNSLHYYDLNVLVYDKIEQYLESECTNPVMICSNFELERLCVVSQKIQRKSAANNRLHILCFCNKDQYKMTVKTQLFLQKQNISVKFYSNILEIIEKIRCLQLKMPHGQQAQSEKIYFYLNQRQKELNQILKIAKKIQKNILNIKIVKIVNIANIISKIERQSYSIIVVSNDSKEMRSYLELYQAIQQKGLQDRVIFIQRNIQYTQKLKLKIEQTVQRMKYFEVSIFKKPLIFYGSLECFKYVLKHFPHLTFKKFIETKEKSLIRSFLQIRTQVILTNEKVCSCSKQYFGSILCQVLYINLRIYTSKSIQKHQQKSCSIQRWFVDESQIYDYYLNQKENSILSLNFNYSNKKMSYIGKMLTNIFYKLKEKNSILYNHTTNQILLFTCQYYNIDQISNYILKYFTTKTFGNYQHQCMFNYFKNKLYQELITIYNCRNLPEEILVGLENDNSEDIFELSQNLLKMASENPDFLQEVNSIWTLFLYQDRAEHLLNCPVLLFLYLLGFNRTSFMKYHNQTLQHLTISINVESLAQDPEMLSNFLDKNRKFFVYNINFLCCQIVQDNRKPLPHEIFIKLQGNELTSFNIYMSIWKNDKTLIIPPLTKFQISTNKNSNCILRLYLNSQQKLLEKFSHHFFQENSTQLKLFKEERQMRKFDFFLETVANSKFQNAGYMLKKIIKQENFKNQDLLNAYSILYYLKKKEFSVAEEMIKADKYSQILLRVIHSFREGQIQNGEQNFVGTELSSIKRIQQNNKQYQFLEETSNENESNDNYSAMFNTDPEMMKHNNFEYKLNKYRLQKGRSPTNVFKQPIKKKNINKVSIRQRQMQPSPFDSTSDLSNKFSQAEPKITISPPSLRISQKENSSFRQFENMKNETFGKMMKIDNVQLGSDRNRNSQKQQIEQLFSIKRSNSQTRTQQENQQLLNIPIIKKTTSSKNKLSKFFQFLPENREDSSEISDINEQTGEFITENLQQVPTKKNEDVEEADIIEEYYQDLQQIEPVQQEQREQQSSVEEDKINNNSSFEYFKFNLANVENNKKRFPIKCKDNCKLPRSSFTRPNKQIYNLKPLVGIVQESLNHSNSNIFSYSSKQNLSISNLSNFQRVKVRKLFTFNQTQQPRVEKDKSKNCLPRVSLRLNNSQMEKGFENSKNKLSNSELVSLSQLSSVSSIGAQEVFQIHPQELIQQQLYSQ